MTDDAELNGLMTQAGFFTSLDDDARRAVLEEMRPVSMDSGKSIFSRGDESKELYLVAKGRVRLSILSAEGRELSFAHAGIGEVFGEIAMLDGLARTADATAIGKVEVLVLGQAAFRRLLDGTPGFAGAVIQFLCLRLREANLQLEGVALHSIEVRLARYLLGLCSQHAPIQDLEELTIDIGMSQGELALLLGASRPKVNGALMELEDQGAVARDGSSMRCNLDELRAISEME